MIPARLRCSRRFSSFVRALEKADGRRLAVVDTHGSLSYDQLLSRAKGLGAALSDELPAGDREAQPRYAIFTPRDRNYLISTLAVWDQGAVAVPLNDGSPAADLEYYVQASQCKAILASATDEKQRAVAEELSRATKTPLKWVDEAIPLSGGETKQSRNDDDDEEKSALFVFTSGTTNRPKAVQLSRRAVRAQLHALRTAWEISSDDRLYLTLPLHHVHGIGILLSTVASHGLVEMAPKFDAAATMSALTRQQDAITLFSAVPTIYAKLIQHYDAQPPREQERLRSAFRHTRLMISGSAALPESIAKKWKDVSGHTLLERMGSTESGLALSNPYRGHRKLNTVGVPLPGYEARLVDIDDPSQPVIKEADKSGELQFRGKGLFSGYWQRPEATAEAMTADGWYKTGDSAHRDEDGYFKIDGRLSADIIKSSGFKLSALEIERYLLECDDAIAEVAVFGVPDEVTGERVVALAVASPRMNLGAAAAEGGGGALELIKSPDAEKLANAIKQDLKTHIAAYKIPSVIAFVSAIPRNAMGKTNKKELRKAYLEAAV